MNSRYQGPAVFPSATEVRKRVEAHLDSLPSLEQKPAGRPARTRKKWTNKLLKLRRRP
jgi:hypothetical protein